MTTPRLLIIKHVKHNNLGAVALACQRLGIDIDLRTPALGDAIPTDLSSYAGVVIMGSPDAVYHDKPYIQVDRDLIAATEKTDLPFLGICFGAQLLAQYIGGEVYRGDKGSVRQFSTITLAQPDPVFGNELAGASVFQWHGDVFTLPDSAVVLATDGAYPLQAFRWGARMYGVQFHPEVTPGVITNWVERSGFPELLPGFLTEADMYLPAVQLWLEAFLRRLFCV